MAQDNLSQRTGTWLDEHHDEVVPLAVLVGLLLLLVGVYWNVLDYRGAMWFWENPKYSHGWLVPIFTVILLWMRYEPLGEVTMAARWTGIAVLAAALAMRLFTTYYLYRVPEMYTFVPAVAGVFLLVGGWKTIRWAWPAIAFLIFMFPLPGFLDRELLARLQTVATEASTYALQTLGIATWNEGNRIVIGNGDIQLGVVEACSGLRMLTIFVALAVAITLVTDRPWWERVVIVVSAVPIALAVNIIRITVTGVLHLTAGPELAEMVFHDLAGWFMMPMALGLLYVEFQVLSHLIIDEGSTGPLQIGGRRDRGPAPLAGA